MNLFELLEKQRLEIESLRAKLAQPTPSQNNCYAGLKAVSYACPQDFLDYKNSYTVSETKTNFYNVALYTQDQVDYILQSQLSKSQPTSHNDKGRVLSREALANVIENQQTEIELLRAKLAQKESK